MSVVNDKIQVIKLSSPKKWSNALLLHRSFKASQRSGKNHHAGMPMALSIEPTTACNLGCPECPSGLKQFTRDTGNLKLELNKKIIDELAPWLMHINYYFQGEPFINPSFLQMVEYAGSKKIYTAASTNAHFITKEIALQTVRSGLKRLIISIDGTTQETYEQYRVNGSLDKVMEGTKNIIAAKKELRSKSPHIIFQFLVVKPNEHQVNDVLELAKQLGVDEVRFKTAQVYDFKNGNPLIPENEKFSRYKKQANGTWKLKNKMENHCWRMWSSCVITWDGLVVPCCFDKDAKHRLGDLKKQSFVDIWQSKTYNDFRQKILTSRSQIDICQNCSEGTKVWA
ncbi:MAG: SPASM domain-containing protein [Bacteroidota bacterium]